MFQTTHKHWSSVTQSDTVLYWFQGWNQPCGGSVSVCVCQHVWMWLIIIIWTDCRLHALLLSLHTHYIWGHAACYNAAATNRWDLIARDLNIASPTTALDVWASVFVCVSTVMGFHIMGTFHYTDDQELCQQWSGNRFSVINTILFLKYFDLSSEQVW